MKSSKSSMETALVGRRVMKSDRFAPGDMAWPVNDPNVNGEHIATIEAVWVDRDDTLKAIFRTPSGRTFEGWVTHHTLLPVVG